MSATVGRLLQLIGMIVLPIGLLYGLGKGEIQTEVRLLAIGGFLFVAGWLMARTRE